MFFDPDYMAMLPFWLERFDPIVEIGKVINKLVKIIYRKL